MKKLHLSILSKGSYPCVYDPIAAFKTNFDAFPYVLLTTLIEKPTLLQFAHKKEGITEKRLSVIFKNIAAAINTIHQIRLIHRDIKPENIHIDSTTDEIILIDFGHSAIIDRLDQPMTGRFGTIFYAAPEVIEKNSTYTYKCDWFSYE